MPVIEVYGKASDSSRFLPYTNTDLETNLLTWLREQGVTVASSCDGKGVCMKCVIQNDWPSCELTLRTFLERQMNGRIIISYL